MLPRSPLLLGSTGKVTQIIFSQQNILIFSTITYQIRTCVDVRMEPWKFINFVSVFRGHFANILMCLCSLNHPGSEYYIVTCGLYGSTLFHVTLSHKRHDFRKKKKVIEHKMYVLIFSSAFVRNISHSVKNSATHYHKCIKIFM